MMMSTLSILTIGVLSSLCAVARQLIALRRYRLRRDSLERVVATATPGTRIVDRDTDGVIEVTVVLPAGALETPPGLPSLPDQPAA